MDVADDHNRLLCAYKRAEDLLHSLGIETGEGIDTTAINELRYAGRHVLNGLNATDPEERDRVFRRAEDHCERALYEAYDNAIFFYFRSFDQFKSDYARIPITETVPRASEGSAPRTYRVSQVLRAASTALARLSSHTSFEGDTTTPLETTENVGLGLGATLYRSQVDR